MWDVQDSQGYYATSRLFDYVLDTLASQQQRSLSSNILLFHSNTPEESFGPTSEFLMLTALLKYMFEDKMPHKLNGQTPGTQHYQLTSIPNLCYPSLQKL